MKAMIIAAGIGRRLSDYSKGKPKTLIEVSGKPILDYILSSLVKEEIKDVLIVTGYNSRKIKNFVNKKYAKLNVEYVHK